MAQVGIVTPVTEGRAHALRTYLSTQLPRDAMAAGTVPTATPVSPFTGLLPSTHFARFVIVDLDGHSYLFFSSRFDGSAGDYLRTLATTAPALTIWSHCEIPGNGEALTEGGLAHYLCDRRNWSHAQYVVSAIPAGVSVAQINRALSLRAELARFVTEAPRLEPIGLMHAFRQLPAIRMVLHRP
ncbi:MAG: hypothetical protein ACJ780_29285 [Solirubrobacteraceae bacterium]